MLPDAVGRWDFSKSLKDEVAGLEAKLHNGAVQKPDGLHLPGGNAYASTAPLTRAIGAKTLTAVVRLQNLAQRGGAAISLQSLDGGLFDAIVFGEREPGHWMPGSDGFRRTKDLGGPAETEATAKPVHIAITYRADGVITGYRNGVAYGKPYKANGLLGFEAKQAMLLFGLRHGPAGGNKHLAGTILRAELFDKVLTPQEVAASAGVASDYIADDEIARTLDEPAKAKWTILRRTIEQAGAKLAEAAPSARVYAVTPRPPEPTYLLERGNLAQEGQAADGGRRRVAGAERGIRSERRCHGRRAPPQTG